MLMLARSILDSNTSGWDVIGSPDISVSDHGWIEAYVTLEQDSYCVMGTAMPIYRAGKNVMELAIVHGNWDAYRGDKYKSDGVWCIIGSKLDA